MGCGAISLLAMLAGTGAQEYGNVSASNAMNQKVSEEMARQKAFQKQASELFQQSLGQSAAPTAQQQIQQGVGQSLGATTNAGKIPFGTASVPLPGTGDDLAQAQLQAQLGLGQQNNAAFQGYGNYGFQQGLKDQSIGGQLGVVNSEARQSAGVLPTELQQAQGSQQGIQALGQLLSTVGLLAGLGSLTAAPAGGAVTGAPGAFDSSWGAWMPPQPALGFDTTWFPGYTGLQ